MQAEPVIASAVWQRSFEAAMAKYAKRAKIGAPNSTIPHAPTFVAGNEAIYLADGREQLAWMLAAIENAKHRIDLEMYIFTPDTSGTAIRDALARAADRGVTVRVHYDAVGSGDGGAEFFEPIARAGGHLVEFQPVAPWRVRVGKLGHFQHWQPNSRDHRKLLVCDAPASWVHEKSPPRDTEDPERVAFAITGGRNIADEYLGQTIHEGQWRDAGVVIMGPSARELGTLFDAMWNHSRGASVAVPALPDVKVGSSAILAIGTQPRQFNLFRWSLVWLSPTIRRELRISSAYFIPNSRFRRILRSVAARGIPCELLIPGASDVPPIDAASRHFLGGLLATGIVIHRYGAGILHEKSIVFDRLLTILGSSNLDPRSFDLNYELCVYIADPRLSEEVAKRHEEGMREAPPYTLADWRNRSMLRRFLDWFWSLLRSQL